MNIRERAIVKRIYPLACRGQVYAIRVLQNLTTKRKAQKECKCGCGERVITAFGKKHKRFFSSLCFQKWKRSERGKKLLTAATAMLLAMASFGAEVKLEWVNGTNAVPMQTHIYYGPVKGGITQILTNKPGVTNCTIRNLRFGTAYFFRAMHMGPLGKEWSGFSNQVTTKTRPPMEATGSKANVGRMRSP